MARNEAVIGRPELVQSTAHVPNARRERAQVTGSNRVARRDTPIRPIAFALHDCTAGFACARASVMKASTLKNGRRFRKAEFTGKEALNLDRFVDIPGIYTNNSQIIASLMLRETPGKQIP